MEIQKIVIACARKKWRFTTVKGPLSFEQLWDLPLKDERTNFDLNTVAQTINRAAKESQEESFVETQSKENKVLAAQLELVKYIIQVKKEEQDKRTKNAANTARRQELANLLASKNQEEMQKMSKDDILKELQALDEGSSDDEF